MIRYLQSSKGKIKRGDNLTYRKPAKDQLLWIFCTAPTDKEINKLATDFSLQKDQFKKYTIENHSVRYSLDPFAFVFFDYYLEGDKVRSARILNIIKDNVIIQVSNISSKYYEEMFKNISEQIELNKIKSLTSVKILQIFLAEDIEENYDVIQKNEQDIIALEEQVVHYESARQTNVQNIIKLKRRLFKMSRRFWASTKVIFLIKSGFTNLRIDEQTGKHLLDIHDTFLHQIDIVTAQKEMATDILSIYSTSLNNKLAMTSNDLSQITKKVSAVGLLLLFPTLITSIYGMNFPHMPLVENPMGFYIILLLIVATTITLFAALKARNWL